MEVLPHIQISSVGFYMSLAELVLALCVELQQPRAPERLRTDDLGKSIWE